MKIPKGKDGLPDFNALSEAEQRVVAERILKIVEAGWRPFWCPLPDCDGFPHQLVDDDGSLMYVGPTDTAGPNGEPIGDCEWEENPDDPDGDPIPFGCPVYDPMWAHNHARVDQRLPPWQKPWILFIMSGRGSGKTTTGTEFVTLCARKGLDGAIIGRRGTELENTHVATLIARAHPDFVPVYYSSKDILVWPNGAITYLFSAERPENIRSVNLSYCWFDEAAWMDDIDKAWKNAKFATRVKSPGNPIHILITSTPTSTPWVIKMDDDPKVEVRRVSTYANRANLDEDFIADMEEEYEGTRTGRQELHGEVLRDVEGAYWNDDMYLHHHCKTIQDFTNYVDALDDRVLAIDPAGSKGPRSDATGIIGVGTHIFDDDGGYLSTSNFSVLLDATIKGSPTEWARQSFKAAKMIKATKIVAEKNFGGDMVKQVLTDFAKLHPEEALNDDGDNMADMIVVEHAVLSKETRAEATVGKYEQHRVTHVTSPVVFSTVSGNETSSSKVGDLSKLEKEQQGWVPKSRGGKSPSPNRIDALVWAIKKLETKIRYKASTANQRDVMKKMKRKGAGPGRAA